MPDFYFPFSSSAITGNEMFSNFTKITSVLIIVAIFTPFCNEANAQAGRLGASKNNNGIQQQIILTDQSLNRVIIADVHTGNISWEWSAAKSNILPADVKWFNAPSDAKSVYGGKYILLNASGGGIALVRIADKKTVFYCYAGGNTHSAELLPDGNIVTASSTGNYLMIFRTDTLHFPANVYHKKIKLPFAHNVVWDKKRNLLWSAGKNHLYSLQYNFNCAEPGMAVKDSILLPGNDAHDLFPIFEKDSLWLTTVDGFFKIDMATRKVAPVNGTYNRNIKSVSSGPKGFPAILSIPKEQWWTDEVLDIRGKSIFKKEGLKIYKARWRLPNLFSYAPQDTIRICNPASAKIAYTGEGSLYRQKNRHDGIAF